MIQSSCNSVIITHGTGISCDRLWYLFTCKQTMQKWLKVLYIVSLKLSIENKHTPEIVSPFHILLKKLTEICMTPPPKAWSTQSKLIYVWKCLLLWCWNNRCALNWIWILKHQSIFQNIGNLFLGFQKWFMSKSYFQ